MGFPYKLAVVPDAFSHRAQTGHGDAPSKQLLSCMPSIWRSSGISRRICVPGVLPRSRQQVSLTLMLAAGLSSGWLHHSVVASRTKASTTSLSLPQSGFLLNIALIRSVPCSSTASRSQAHIKYTTHSRTRNSLWDIISKSSVMVASYVCALLGQFPVGSIVDTLDNERERRIELIACQPPKTPLAQISQCAQKARITSGGRNHPDSCWFDLVAGRRFVRVTGWIEAL